MKRILSLALIGMTPAFGHADPGQMFTAGLLSAPLINTVAADSGVLACRGNVGCNYKVSILLSSTLATTFRLETLDNNSVVLSANTIYLPIPANDVKTISLPSAFFIPNGYRVRLVNNVAIPVLNTIQASLFLEVTEAN